MYHVLEYSISCINGSFYSYADSFTCFVISLPREVRYKRDKLSDFLGISHVEFDWPLAMPSYLGVSTFSQEHSRVLKEGHETRNSGT